MNKNDPTQLHFVDSDMEKIEGRHLCHRKFIKNNDLSILNLKTLGHKFGRSVVNSLI